MLRPDSFAKKRNQPQVEHKNQFDYSPCYCEENVWQLCREPRFQGQPAYVVFASNHEKSCAIWRQRAAHSPGAPMIWDYHVILLSEEQERGWLAWDLDSTLDFPVKAETWLQLSFAMGRSIPETYRPLFRLLTSQEYLQHLSTDRSHMRDENDAWLAPPPEWEPPFQPELGMNLFRFVQMEEEFVGEILDLPSMWRRFVGIDQIKAQSRFYSVSDR